MAIFETKFSARDRVFMMENNKVVDVLITKVHLLQYMTTTGVNLVINYSLDGYTGTAEESTLFKNKKDLLCSL